MLNFKNQKNTKMEKGEEKLNNTYSPRVIKGKTKILAGVDCGSTQTRVIIIGENDDTDALDEMYVIPSNHSSISSYEEILSQSPRLYDNMDSWITSLSNKPDGLFDKVRVLRGTKQSDANVPIQRINSTRQKIDTSGFYLNIIDGIALALIQRGGDLYSDYDVYLGTSLPPDNIFSKRSREIFENRMTRSFTYDNKSLGVTFNINIKKVVEQTESESEIRAYSIKNDVDTEDQTSLLIEVGGSTVGTAILKGNTSVKTAGKTFRYGGTQLRNLLGNIIEEEVGTTTDKQLRIALEEGTVRNRGKGVTDVTEQVCKAKKEFARQIYSDVFADVFDQLGNSDTELEDITNVYFGGRCFLPGNYNPETGEGYSLAQPLAELLTNDLPDAEFVTISENLIPYGNAILAYERLSEIAFGEDEVEVKDEVSANSQSETSVE